MHLQKLALLVLFGLVALLALLAVAPAAHAQADEDPAAMARRYFNSGQKAFTEGRFTEAAKAFEEAYRIKPHPAPLINAGDAWEKAGEYALAARAYQRVLELSDAGEQDRSDAVDRLAGLTPKLGIIELKGSTETRARVGPDEFAGGSKVYVLPGEHEVTLIDVDGAKLRKVEVAAGTRRTVDLETLRPGGPMKADPDPVPITNEPGADQPTESGGIRAVTWIAYGVAALGVGGAVYFGLQVNDAEDAYDENPNRDDLDRFNDNKLLTNVSLGVAVVGAGLGTFFLIQDLGSKPDKQARYQPPVDVAPITGGAVLVGRGQF